MPPDFADHFSGVASNYLRFRPHYPGALFDWLESVSAPGASVWDCGAGSGQATMALAERFASVIATDASGVQLAEAPPHPRVQWRVAPAEASGIDARSIDLITVAQALHWFDLPAFWREVQRVVAPDAVVAAWTYGDPVLDTTELNEMLREFSHGTLAPFWPPERAHVDAGYSTIEFPFVPLRSPDFTMRAFWTSEEFVGYALSWSATVRCVATHGESMVANFAARLKHAWGPGPREVRWPLTMRAGRV